MKAVPASRLLTVFLLSRYTALNQINAAGSLRNTKRIHKLENTQRVQKIQPEEPIICTLFSILHKPLPGNQEIEPTLHCVTDDNISMPVININEDYTNPNFFQSGKTKFSVLRAGVSQHGEIDMTVGSGVIISDNTQIMNAISSTNKAEFNFAVIRVSDNHGHSPDITLSQLSDKIFGNRNDSFSLATGYQECSGNKVSIRPAIGSAFSHGVMDLTIAKNISGVDRNVVQDYVTKQLSNNGFNPSAYTNVMYVFPAGVNMRGAAAYATLNGRISVFSNSHVSTQYVLMHEIGHNFGHHHSSEHTRKYGDDTGMMGHQVYKDDAPHACFNGAKSWYFQWYSDRHTEVTPTSASRILNMLSIDDYLNDQVILNDQHTIARIVGTNEIDLFVMYNRAEGINSQVLGHKDQVTIVSQEGESKESFLEAGLSLNESDGTSRWTKSNWDGSGNTLVVQLCDRITGTPDYAKVLVYLQGINDLSCGCALGMYKLEIEIMTDEYGLETSWWLKGRNANQIVFGDKIDEDKNLPSSRSTKKDVCIDNSKCYKFKIEDEERNGLCCEYGEGWYHITANGNTLRYSRFKDSRNEVTVFGIC